MLKWCCPWHWYATQTMINSVPYSRFYLVLFILYVMLSSENVRGQNLFKTRVYRPRSPQLPLIWTPVPFFAPIHSQNFFTKLMLRKVKETPRMNLNWQDLELTTMKRVKYVRCNNKGDCWLVLKACCGLSSKILRICRKFRPITCKITSEHTSQLVTQLVDST